MTLTLLQYVLGGFSGVLVGLTLGLFGGGGSILAVPLMVYLVGVPVPHMAIGTSALAVAANAATGLISHARHGSVRWRPALFFTLAGIAGAWLGSTLGKAFDGQRLLFLFAILMIVVAAMMFRSRDRRGVSVVTLDASAILKLVGFGLGAGALSGFFGIGGGFLIVPALIAATGMDILLAVGTSLVAVAAFGLTTAANYAFSGFVDWPLAAVFIAGGIAGGLIGENMARRLSTKGGALNIAFAGLVVVVAVYMLVKSGMALL